MNEELEGKAEPYEVTQAGIRLAHRLERPICRPFGAICSGSGIVSGGLRPRLTTAAPSGLNMSARLQPRRSRSAKVWNRRRDHISPNQNITFRQTRTLPNEVAVYLSQAAAIFRTGPSYDYPEKALHPRRRTRHACPEGAKVISQGRKPLERIAPTTSKPRRGGRPNAAGCHFKRYLGSYCTLCRSKNMTNSSSKVAPR